MVIRISIVDNPEENAKEIKEAIDALIGGESGICIKCLTSTLLGRCYKPDYHSFDTSAREEE